jgi:hypothetical protein
MKALLVLAVVPAIAIVVILVNKWDPHGRDIDAEDYETENEPALAQNH